MTAELIWTAVGGFLAALLASSGLWGFIMYKAQKKDKENDDMKVIRAALMGILYSDILDAGERYIQRGYITLKQLNNFKKYLYDPYKALGGDGMADEVWDNLSDLPHTEI